MKKLFLFSCFLTALLGLARPAAAQTYQWVLRPGGTGGTTMERCMTADAQGNVYVAGRISGTVAFGGTSLTGPAAFVAKLNPSGQWLWARHIPFASALPRISGIAADAAGNLYLTGVLVGSATFGTTVLNAPALGTSEVFVAKLDAQGLWQWAVQTVGSGAGGYHSAQGTALAIDPSTGDPVLVANGEGNFAYGSTTITGSAAIDAVVARLSAGTGQWLWAKALATTSNDGLNGVALDAAGDIYVTGHVRDPLTLGTLPPLPGNTADAVVAKLSGNGQTWLWAARFGGTDEDFGVAVRPLASGEVVAVGSFKSSFYLGSTQLRSAGDRDIYVVRFSAAGVFVPGSAQRVGGNGRDEVSNALADAAGNLVLSGNFNAPATFGATTYPQALQSYATSFVARYLASGSWPWVATAGGDHNVFGMGVATDATGSQLYSAGYIIGRTAQFGTLPAITSTNGDVVFVTRLSNVLATRPAALGGQAVQLWPNPATGQCAVRVPALPGATAVAATLLDGLGRAVRHFTLPSGTTTALDLAGVPAGLYVLRLAAGAETTTLRLAVE